MRKSVCIFYVDNHVFFQQWTENLFYLLHWKKDTLVGTAGFLKKMYLFFNMQYTKRMGELHLEAKPPDIHLPSSLPKPGSLQSCNPPSESSQAHTIAFITIEIIFCIHCILKENITAYWLTALRSLTKCAPVFGVDSKEGDYSSWTLIMWTELFFFI